MSADERFDADPCASASSRSATAPRAASTRTRACPRCRNGCSARCATRSHFESRLIPDEQAGISAALIELVDAGCSLVLTTGGTGPALRDVTPEATLAVAHKEMPGFGEQMRQISLRFVPTAILSRQVAVIRDQSLILNLPGQPKAIAETLEGLKNADGIAGRAGHLCRGALLHRPDRRAVSGNGRRGVQGVPAEVGCSSCSRSLSLRERAGVRALGV